MTTLVNTSNKGPSSKKKGRSKKAHVLAVSVEQATQNFLEKGEQIAKDSQDLKEELIAAVEEVRKQGEQLVITLSYCPKPNLLLICSNVPSSNQTYIKGLVHFQIKKKTDNLLTSMSSNMFMYFFHQSKRNNGF